MLQLGKRLRQRKVKEIILFLQQQDRALHLRHGSAVRYDDDSVAEGDVGAPNKQWSGTWKPWKPTCMARCAFAVPSCSARDFARAFRDASHSTALSLHNAVGELGVGISPSCLDEVLPPIWLHHYCIVDSQCGDTDVEVATLGSDIQKRHISFCMAMYVGNRMVLSFQPCTTGGFYRAATGGGCVHCEGDVWVLG